VEKDARSAVDPGESGRSLPKGNLLLYPMQCCADGKLGDHVMIAPPAVITAEEIRWAVEQLGDAIHEAQVS
jgi:adenosylmethionine-8-amino-7-oxononanoate aminotransferase